MLEVGTVVKNFTLEDAYGQQRSLYDYQGKILILFFYPKNNTTSCTIEACSFRDQIDEFAKRNIEIVGISRDSVISHFKFTKKYDLPFTLLSDSKQKVIKYFDVLNVPSNPKAISRAKRVTFIIDKDSKIIYSFETVKPADHAEDVLKILDELKV